ncbi:MAG: hypothetical protein GY820_46385 [Gammaproteobacteria bacterium]|nr:hypothetical protein [Gammaproteobacteria bacterium]
MSAHTRRYHRLDQCISLLLCQRQLLIYQVPDPASLHSESARAALLTDQQGQTTRICSSAAALLNDDQAAGRRFRSKRGAQEFLETLNPSDQQLQAIVKQLDGPTFSTSDARHARLDYVSQALVDGDAVASIETPQAAPPERDQEEQLETPVKKPLAHETLPPRYVAATTGLVDTALQAAAKTEPACELSAFSMKCDHGDRGYDLDVIKDPLNFNNTVRVIRVVDSDHINLDFSGNCVNGNPQCPAVEISGNQGSKLVTQTQSRFAVKPPNGERAVNNFGDFLRDWLLPDLPSFDYARYTLNNQGCDGITRHSAEVHCFPQFEWGGEVSFSYQSSPEAGQSNRGNFAAALEGKFDTSDWKLEHNSIDSLKDFFPKWHEFLNPLVEKFEEMHSFGKEKAEALESGGKAKTGISTGGSDALIKFDLKTQLALSGKLKLEEVTGASDVGFGGEIGIKLSPFLGAEVSTDIIDWIVAYFDRQKNAHTGLIGRVRDRLEQGVGNKAANVKALIALVFSVDGRLDGDFKWHKQAASDWQTTAASDTSASAKLQIGMKLEGKIRVEGRVFVVKFIYGVRLAMAGASQSSDGVGIYASLAATSAAGKPALGGEIGFTGVAIYYSYYLETFVKGDVSDDKGEGRRRGQGKTGGMDASEIKQTEAKIADEAEGRFVLLQPQTWPPQGAEATPVHSIEF